MQWGRWDCKSKEMAVGILFHVEFLKLNKEAIVWKIILPDYLQASATTLDPIGYGVYQDKLYHLAR